METSGKNVDMAGQQARLRAWQAQQGRERAPSSSAMSTRTPTPKLDARIRRELQTPLPRVYPNGEPMGIGLILWGFSLMGVVWAIALFGIFFAN